MDKGEAINKLKLYCQLLEKSGIRLNKAFLYGSIASGTNHEDSDIDVMLVSEIFDTDDVDPGIKAWSLTRSIDTRIEPYTVGLNRFKTDNISPIIQIVKEQGIEIAF
ncbi:MAG: nucleotidyltransferase domain-containing protein [Bacteroidales bacterium]